MANDPNEELACPLLTQPTDNMCTGDYMKLLANNVAILERVLLRSIVPAGIVYSYAGRADTTPTKFLYCDGSAYSPETYPELFRVIGYSYGRTEDDCFRVPDLRGAILRGVDGDKGCIKDVSSWQGKSFNSGEDLLSADQAGATNVYSNASCGVGSGDEARVCANPEKQVLVTPLISTGEACMDAFVNPEA